MDSGLHENKRGAAMIHHIIETENIRRSFGSTHAVQNLTLQVPPGCIYGFLGPNGAGKTTTIRMLLGLIRPDAGKITMFGRPLGENRLEVLQRIGSLVESPSLYPHLTGRENLEVIRRMTGGTTKEINRVLAVVGMEHAANRLVREYSLGMRQRLGLGLALFREPELLILDEPTNGLDPAGIHEIRELICGLPQKGITVFLSSHLLNEVEQMADRIGIIENGRLIFQGSPAELQSRFQDYVSVSTDRLEETHVLLQRSGWQAVHRSNHHLSVPVNGKSDAAMINAQLVQAGHQVYELNMVHPSLEDIFLTFTGK
jgi:lantibiotic transport system ATP-binding protein